MKKYNITEYSVGIDEHALDPLINAIIGILRFIDNRFFRKGVITDLKIQSGYMTHKEIIKNYKKSHLPNPK